jgi:uncharacterized protein YqeY
MNLKSKIREDMKTAMKAKEKDKLLVLRSLISEIKKKEIEISKEPDDEQVLGVIKSGVKSREDSYQAYKSAGRTELADKELFEINVLKGYLPAQMSKDEVEKAVMSAIAETGASSMRDMGKVMKLILSKYGASVDGKLVSSIVKEKLG